MGELFFGLLAVALVFGVFAWTSKSAMKEDVGAYMESQSEFLKDGMERIHKTIYHDENGVFYKDGEAWMIPCERESDGVLGYYNVETKEFEQRIK